MKKQHILILLIIFILFTGVNIFITSSVKNTSKDVTQNDISNKYNYQNEIPPLEQWGLEEIIQYGGGFVFVEESEVTSEAIVFYTDAFHALNKAFIEFIDSSYCRIGHLGYYDINDFEYKNAENYIILGDSILQLIDSNIEYRIESIETDETGNYMVIELDNGEYVVPYNMIDWQMGIEKEYDYLGNTVYKYYVANNWF